MIPGRPLAARLILSVLSFSIDAFVGASGRALAEPEREELKRLRKENRNLRTEKEILKKASAFFAKEMK